jgi:cytochrome c
MRHLFFLTLLWLCFSCRKSEKTQDSLYPQTQVKQNPEALGQEIFDNQGLCYTCHKEDKKTIGPSLVEIATIYKNKNGNIVAFLQEKSSPIVDPSQYETMKTNFAITKNLSQEELKALEAYILSFSK